MIGDSAGPKERAYPLPRPDDDARFTLGLTLDVAKVLEEHGYPPVVAGADFVELQSALFRFIYAPSSGEAEELAGTGDRHG